MRIGAIRFRHPDFLGTAVDAMSFPFQMPSRLRIPSVWTLDASSSLGAKNSQY